MRNIVIFSLILLHQLFCVVTYLFVNTNGVKLKYLVTSYGECLQGSDRFAIYEGFSISACVAECGLRKHCKVLNFIEQANVCELFSSDNGEIKDSSKCVIVKRMHIEDIRVPCEESCIEGKTCDIVSKTCIYKECLNVSVPNNGEVLGNRKEVEKTIRYICKPGYSEINGVTNAKCGRDGTWSSFATCVRDCGEPAVINGSIVAGKTTEESIREVKCDNDKLSLNTTCLNNGSWSPNPSCTVINRSCVNDSECLNFDKKSMCKDAKCECKLGFTAEAGDCRSIINRKRCNNDSVCFDLKDNSTCNNETDTCICKSGFIEKDGECTSNCGEPAVTNGSIVAGKTTEESIREVKCDNDKLSLNTTCLNNGSWSPNPSCTVINRSCVNDSECLNFDKKSMCKDAKCECKLGFTAEAGDCRSIINRKRCNNDSVCLDLKDNSTCNNETYTCICKSGFIEKDGECTSICKPPWDLLHSSCYYFSKDKKNWTDAKDYCEEQNATLLNVEEEGEHNTIREYLLKLVDQNSNGFTWIGGRYHDTKRIYIWLDNTTVAFDGLKHPSGSKDKCIIYRYKPKDDALLLSKYNCEKEYRFICKSYIDAFSLY